MDKFQAAFEVLFILSAIDGHCDDRELDVIKNYVFSNFGRGNYDVREVMDTILLLSPEGMLEELSVAAAVVDSHSNAQDKVKILEFALEVIVADRRVTDSEKAVFLALGNYWNINVNRFLASR
jgi:hypothetical protein